MAVVEAAADKLAAQVHQFVPGAALGQVDPAHGEDFMAGAEDYAGELEALDREFADFFTSRPDGVLVFGGRALFGFLSVPQDVLGEALSYTMIVGSFVLVQGLYMNFAAILRNCCSRRSQQSAFYPVGAS